MFFEAATPPPDPTRIGEDEAKHDQEIRIENAAGTDAEIERH